ncbi:MAG TPA: site-specific DNA-methyltransferase [Gallicola sp.]|nr:site-specific DNA-methyltransferase [Gallicola sp.]
MIGEYKLNEIYNEDCYEAIKRIPDKSVDCVYVDVPYLYKTGGAGTSDIAKRATKNKMELMGVGNLYEKNLKPSENLRIAQNKKKAKQDLLNANLSDGFDYKTFIKETFRIMKKPNMFIWCSPMQILDLMNEINKYTVSTINILTWNKTNPIPTTNNNWLSDIEYCLYVRDNIKLNDGYELKSKWYISPINKPDKDLYNHPTIKPLELVKRHLLHTTQENDIVADFFLGSGTTCVAAKEIGRKYIGFEIDKKYYEIAKDRLNGISADGQMSIFTDFEQMKMGFD